MQSSLVLVVRQLLDDFDMAISLVHEVMRIVWTKLGGVLRRPCATEQIHALLLRLLRRSGSGIGSRLEHLVLFLECHLWKWGLAKWSWCPLRKMAIGFEFLYINCCLIACLIAPVI